MNIWTLPAPNCSKKESSRLNPWGQARHPWLSIEMGLQELVRYHVLGSWVLRAAFPHCDKIGRGAGGWALFWERSWRLKCGRVILRLLVYKHCCRCFADSIIRSFSPGSINVLLGCFLASFPRRESVAKWVSKLKLVDSYPCLFLQWDGFAVFHPSGTMSLKIEIWSKWILMTAQSSFPTRAGILSRLRALLGFICSSSLSTSYFSSFFSISALAVSPILRPPGRRYLVRLGDRLEKMILLQLHRPSVPSWRQ